MIILSIIITVNLRCTKFPGIERKMCDILIVENTSKFNISKAQTDRIRYNEIYQN